MLNFNKKNNLLLRIKTKYILIYIIVILEIQQKKFLKIKILIINKFIIVNSFK